MYVRRVQETLSQEILTKMHAPSKGDYPIATPEVLTQYNAFLFGIPTRYGNMPAQWKVRLLLSPFIFCIINLIMAINYRLYGTLLVNCGLLASSQASMLGCSYRLLGMVEVKNQL